MPSTTRLAGNVAILLLFAVVGCLLIRHGIRLRKYPRQPKAYHIRKMEDSRFFIGLGCAFLGMDTLMLLLALNLLKAR